MKKFLLVTVAMFTAMVSFAQEFNENSDEMNATISELEIEALNAPAGLDLAVDDEATESKIKRSGDDSLYYYRPEGTLWRGMTNEGSSYYVSYLIVPPFYDVVFENQSPESYKSGSSWTINGNDRSSYVTDDGDFDFGQHYYNGYSYYVPQVAYGDATFELGEWNTYASETKGYGYGAMVKCDTVNTLSFTDVSYGTRQNDDIKTYSSSSSNSTYFMFGPGLWTVSGEQYEVYRVSQTYPQPVSPLYVEYIFAQIRGDRTPLLEDGTTLYMYVYNEDETELLATLTATADDVELWNGPYTTSYSRTGEYYTGLIMFSASGTDVFGNTYSEPLILDEPFTLVLDIPEADTGMNFGYYSVTAPSQDRSIGTGTHFSCRRIDENGDTIVSNRYYSSQYIKLNFQGCFDYVECEEELSFYTDATYTETVDVSDMNQLMVSDDGTTVYNIGYYNQFGSTAMDYAYVYANFDWTNGATGDYEYTYELPDWISELTVEDSGDGYFYVTVTADELPSGTDNRSASIYFEGKGYTSTMPLKVLQGEGADGISSVEVTSNNANSDNRTYNVAGQQVDDTYKGLVIKNGNKFIRK